MYVPNTQLALNLLHSLPKKAMMWLQTLGVTANSGRVGHVSYYFPADAVGSHLTIDTDEGPITIDWAMDIHNADGTGGSHVYFLDLENHLDWFIELEKLVYNDFEQFAELVNKNSTIETSESGEEI